MRFKGFFLIGILLTATFAARAQGIPAESLENRVNALRAGGTALRSPGSPENEVAAQYIADVFEKAGLQPFYSGQYIDEFTSDPLVGNARKTYRNVAGIIYGSDYTLDGEYIVIGAHYDFNGENDNVSGVAALLELAHSLKECSPGRNIILVAFDGFELGLLGSRSFMHESSVPADHICLMVNLQGIGAMPGEPTVYYHLRNITEQSVGQFTDIETPYETSLNWNGYKGRTDTEPFTFAGIPTIHITTYPGISDRGDMEIDYTVLREVTGMVSSAVCALANTPVIEKGGNTGKKKKKAPLFEGGITASAGTSFMRNSEGGTRGKTQFSYGAGLYGQLNVSYFGLRPEVQFVNLGSRSVIGRIRMNSILVPVSIMAQSPRILGGSFHLFAGGYYRYTFSGKEAGRDMDFSKEWYRNGAGIQWGLGLKFRRFGIEVTNRYGLTDMLRDNTNKLTERATYATLSYRF